VLDTHSPLVCLSIAPLYGLRYSPALANFRHLTFRTNPNRPSRTLRSTDRNTPPGNPPPPPGNPPPGGPPKGGLTHLNGILGGSLLLPCVLGGSAWSGPIAQYRATSSSLTCPVTRLIVPIGTGIVSVWLIGSPIFSDSANVCAIS
jgi:hypothetical protein